MLSDIGLIPSSKLLHKDLQIKFDRGHGWPTFGRVDIVLCNKFSFLDFPWLPHAELQTKSDFGYGWPTFDRVNALCNKKLSYPDFSWLCFQISSCSLVASFPMYSYRSGSTCVTIVHFQVPETRLFKTLILHARLQTSRTLPLFSLWHHK